MKILVAGDLHASYRAASKLVDTAAEHSPDMIWQVGDFGYWPRIAADHTDTFLTILESVELPIFFADGNHDDHESLNSAADHHEVNFIRPYIGHVPRGTVLGVGGLNVLFFGGARSVDRTYRTPGFDWFADELPTVAQYEKALAHEAVDVVVAHEVPNWVDFGYPPADRAWWPAGDIIVSEEFRRELGQLSLKLKPKVWFGGHHHRRKWVPSEDDGWPDIHVLDCDGGRGCFVLFDTETLEVTDV